MIPYQKTVRQERERERKLNQGRESLVEFFGKKCILVKRKNYDHQFSYAETELYIVSVTVVQLQVQLLQN